MLANILNQGFSNKFWSLLSLFGDVKSAIVEICLVIFPHISQHCLEYYIFSAISFFRKSKE